MNFRSSSKSKSVGNLFNLFFLTVMLIGAFALCYLPGFVCVLLTSKLGPSRVPNALRSAFVVLMGINSALNPIIYMFRSNEFRIILRKLFRGGSISTNIGGNASASLNPSRLGASTWQRTDRQPSFLTVPTENITVLSDLRPSSGIYGVAGVSNINTPSLMITSAESLEVRESVITKPSSPTN